ncbi:MAG: RNA polymerase factor sigma-54 [Helicobacter sp.]|nr:RNA polymerase factor sigma-54 [Helicobacter sp.]
MKLKTRASTALKNKLSSTLKSWLPILQSSVGDLEEALGEFAKENPYFEIQSGIVSNLSAHKKKIPEFKTFKEVNHIENSCIQEESLENVLFAQITPPLFPTTSSQNIAKKIIENLNEEGYFEGDCHKIAQEVKSNVQEIEKIRKRFAYLDPPGIAAKNLIESFYFQLYNMDIESGIFDLCLKILRNIENHSSFKNEAFYQDSMKIIQSFKNPPAIDFFEKEPAIISDILILEEEDNIQVQINEKYYPSIQIQTLPKKNELYAKEDFIKAKIKEARDLVDALEMRKATLYKIGLMLVEYQYEFFMGGEIKPMKLKDLAEEFGHAPSTISRAISNKFLECSRGIFPLKIFFATALDEDTSNLTIKDFLAELIKNENRQKPLSDTKILKLIEEKFSIKIVRRTITKYRAHLNIASSSERKKRYKISAI